MNAERKHAAVDYVPELDSLRTLAILSVMCIHWLPRSNWINRLQHDTGWGVYLFFVLSGFLITRILMRCRETVELHITTRPFSLRQFYARRFLRIFPLYYFLLFIGFALNVDGVRDSIVWHAAYLSNFYFVKHNGFIGPTTPFWSLAVEEQFYLLWPFAILFLPLKKIMPFVLLMAIIGVIFKSAVFISHRNIDLILIPACVQYLAIGALIAVCEHPLIGSAKARAKLLNLYLALAVVFAVISVSVRILLPQRHGLFSINLHIGSLVLFGWIVGRSAQGVAGVVGSMLRFAPIVYLGKISYGLYCYHSFMKWTLLWFVPYLSRWVGNQHAVGILSNFGVRFIVTVAVASASWWWFEKPLNDLKRFFPYTHKGRPLPLEERGIPVPS